MSEYIIYVFLAHASALLALILVAFRLGRRVGYEKAGAENKKIMEMTNDLIILMESGNKAKIWNQASQILMAFPQMETSKKRWERRRKEILKDELP